MVDESIRITVRWNIQAGQVEAFKAVAREITASVEAEEPRTRSYEWYLSDDGAEGYLTEVMSDSDAFMAHLANVGQSVGPLYAIASIADMLVFGSPNAQVRDVLAGAGARFFPGFAGFTR
jgi:quinol monooxygenase YgiN